MMISLIILITNIIIIFKYFFFRIKLKKKNLLNNIALGTKKKKKKAYSWRKKIILKKYFHWKLHIRHHHSIADLNCKSLLVIVGGNVNFQRNVTVLNSNTSEFMVAEFLQSVTGVRNQFSDEYLALQRHMIIKYIRKLQKYDLLIKSGQPTSIHGKRC